MVVFKSISERMKDARELSGMVKYIAKDKEVGLYCSWERGMEVVVNKLMLMLYHAIKKIVMS